MAKPARGFPWLSHRSLREVRRTRELMAEAERRSLNPDELGELQDLVARARPAYDQAPTPESA